MEFLAFGRQITTMHINLLINYNAHIQGGHIYPSKIRVYLKIGVVMHV